MRGVGVGVEHLGACPLGGLPAAPARLHPHFPTYAGLLHEHLEHSCPALPCTARPMLRQAPAAAAALRSLCPPNSKLAQPSGSKSGRLSLCARTPAPGAPHPLPFSFYSPFNRAGTCPCPCAGHQGLPGLGPLAPGGRSDHRHHSSGGPLAPAAAGGAAGQLGAVSWVLSAGCCQLGAVSWVLLVGRCLLGAVS